VGEIYKVARISNKYHAALPSAKIIYASESAYVLQIKLSSDPVFPFQVIVLSSQVEAKSIHFFTQPLDTL
jgi:hypothetical protein